MSGAERAEEDPMPEPDTTRRGGDTVAPTPLRPVGAVPATREVTLTVPADTDVLSLVRLNASLLASFAAFTVDEVDDLRIAVDEAVAYVAAVPGGDRIELRFVVGPDSLELEAVRAGTTGHEPLSELAQIVLGATTDEFEHVLGPSQVRVRLRKRRGA